MDLIHSVIFASSPLETRVISRQLCTSVAHFNRILGKRLSALNVGGDGLDPFQYQTQIPLCQVERFLFTRGAQ
jgi:hypothetical protein